MNDIQKAQIEKHMQKIDTAIHSNNISEIYDVWTKINSIYGGTIRAIGDLYEEAKRFNGLAKRNLEAAKDVLENHINNYTRIPFDNIITIYTRV